MFEKKDFSNIYTVFSFVVAILNRVLGDGEIPQLTTVHAVYSKIVSILMNIMAN